MIKCLTCCLTLEDCNFGQGIPVNRIIVLLILLFKAINCSRLSYDKNC